MSRRTLPAEVAVFHLRPKIQTTTPAVSVHLSIYSSHPSPRFRNSPPLPITRPFHLLVLNDFDPISVRIEDESHVLHPPVRQTLLPVHLFVVEALARGVEVVD